MCTYVWTVYRPRLAMHAWLLVETLPSCRQHNYYANDSCRWLCCQETVFRMPAKKGVKKAYSHMHVAIVDVNYSYMHMAVCFLYSFLSRHSENGFLATQPPARIIRIIIVLPTRRQSFYKQPCMHSKPRPVYSPNICTHEVIPTCLCTNCIIISKHRFSLINISQLHILFLLQRLRQYDAHGNS